MRRTATCLSVLLLSEDSGEHAFEVLKGLAKELFKQVDEYVQTNAISFDPVREKLALSALHANIWKSRKPNERQKRVELIRTLATQVMREDGWALFHFDGDRAWAARESSENVPKFQEFTKSIRLLLSEEIEKRSPGTSSRDIEAEVDARMTRLKTVVPFYSIEAWLFQNTHEAVRLCHAHFNGRDADQFHEWAGDRTALDERLKPKEAVCLGAAHNRELASTAFPTREVLAAGKSFAATVESLREDAKLREALARTYAPEMSGPALSLIHI